MKEAYKFKWYYILFIFIIIGFVVGQVILDLKLPDYMGEIFKDIQMIELTNSPISSMLGLETKDYYIQDIWKNGGMMLLVTLGSITCTVIASYFAARTGAGVAYVLRNKVFKKVESFSLKEFNKFQTPSLITRTTNDITQVQMVITMVLRMAVSAPITAGIAIYKAATRAKNCPDITWIIVVGILILVLFVIFMFIVVFPKFKLTQKLTDKLNLVTRENLTGLRVVRAYNAEEYEKNKFNETNNAVMKNNLFVNRTTSLMMPVMMLTMNGISLAIYWMGSSLINKQLIDLPSVSVFQQYTMQIVMSFMMIAMLCVIIPRGIVSFMRIKEVLNVDVDITTGDKKTDIDTIEFKNVSFKYESKNVLENISFDIKKGETVAIIGATGAGKTSLINLIPRFYDVSNGEILINGINVKELDLSYLRKNIGYVAQKATLFSGTIKSNLDINLSNLSEEEIKNRIDEAIEIAQAKEFVDKLDDSYDHLISQGGSNVSGGQRQRLSIARAVIKKPQLLIFDDSFSALDFKTDKALRSALKKSTENQTSIIVAQRIGTIMHADKIIVLENGKIVGMGKHKELLNNCAVYREIAESQLSKEELL